MHDRRSEVENFWSTFGQLLVNFWSTFGQLLVNFWSTFGQLLVNFWSITRHHTSSCVVILARICAASLLESPSSLPKPPGPVRPCVPSLDLSITSTKSSA